MVLELIIICITLYAIFGDYFSARAEILREQAREKQLENDRKELE